jgi:hypothetical protein
VYNVKNGIVTISAINKGENVHWQEKGKKSIQRKSNQF